MRLMSLNVWAGIRIDPLAEYIRAEAAATDIFCFQEVVDGLAGYGDVGGGYRADTYALIKAALPGFIPYYAPAEENVNELLTPLSTSVSIGQATFVRSAFEVVGSGKVWVSESPTEILNKYVRPRCMQHITIRTPGGMLEVGNLHGVLDGGRKDDSPARSRQFQIIADFFSKIHHSKILCGDFNARPETKSLLLLEKEMTNLIRANDVRVTRTHLYPGMEQYGDNVSDYIFTSPEIKVNKFYLPPVTEISDHLPLILEFSL